MKSFFLTSQNEFNSEIFTPEWLFKTVGEPNDVIVSFVADTTEPLNEAGNSFTDDVTNTMLHVLVSHKKNIPLPQLKLHQCVLLDLFATILGDGFFRESNTLNYLDNLLGVSSTIGDSDFNFIHCGLFLHGSTTNARIMGLDDLDVNPQTLAIQLMHRYLDEMKEIYTP